MNIEEKIERMTQENITIGRNILFIGILLSIVILFENIIKIDINYI